MFLLRKFYIEQMFVLVRTQFRHHVDTLVKRFKRCKGSLVLNSKFSEGTKWLIKYSNPRAALWDWRNIGGTWTLLETAFTSYFLRKVSRAISFLAVSTFVQKELVHPLAEHFQTSVNKVNNFNVIYLRIPKNRRGSHRMRMSRSTCGPRVWDAGLCHI